MIQKGKEISVPPCLSGEFYPFLANFLMVSVT
jgi:hypothetical protein